MTEIFFSSDAFNKYFYNNNRFINKIKSLSCKIEIAPKIFVRATAINDKIFIFSSDENINLYLLDNEDVEPFIKVEVCGEAYTKTIIKEMRDPKSFFTYNTIKKECIDSYNENYNYHTKTYNEGIPYNYLNLKIISNDGFEASGALRFRRPNYGIAHVDKVDNVKNIPITLNFFGKQLSWYENVNKTDSDERYYIDNTWQKTNNLFKNYEIKPSKKALWDLFLINYDNLSLDNVPSKGVKALEKSKIIAPNLEKLKAEEPTLYKFYAWLHNEKTNKGITNNQCLAAFLKTNGSDYIKLKTELQSVMDLAEKIDYEGIYINKNECIFNRNICLLFDAARARDEEQRSHKEWYLKKTAGEQAVALGIDSIKYPLLYNAIFVGNIPLGIFHNPDDKLNVINVEFELWEKALAKPGWAEVLYSIAQNASRRNTYERDITPYISFLFKITKYLDKHAPGNKAWEAMPSYVNSEWQLEMDEASEDGTVKKRSALTPVADNENLIVTVPYAAIAVHGRQTTYCYSKHYFVFEEYMIDDESGSVIMRDLEPKLNGRDDYGLMYYTLTGTPRNRGYPTFLIIFERIKEKQMMLWDAPRSFTRVHFHRVHPCRSKDGRSTPACKLIEECYRYMAGNIRAEEIYAQQGDLIFIKSEEPKHENLVKVKDFESHMFISRNAPVMLVQNISTTIKNRLGYVFCDSEFNVEHPEHQNIENIPPGWYEVRRAKSWEANPKAVWSITID
jgi:hypothetical protein